VSHRQPYPAYKDSGVEWLGTVPKHWVFKKLKYIAQFSGGGTPSRDNLKYWNGNIPWVSPKDMKSEAIHGAEEGLTAEGLLNSTSSLVSPHHVLIVVRSGILRHTIPIAINEVAVALNQDMKALHFNPRDCVSKFFLRWVQGFNDDLLQAWLKQGATVESVEQDYLANTIVPMPSVEEQRAIIAYVDRETFRINALVAKKTRFIELLREKRQTLITHAVTKGLDPTVTMKDSGVKWMGKIPDHWKMKKLRHIARIVRGASPRPAGDPKYFISENDADANTPWLTVAEITKDNEMYLVATSGFLTPLGVQQSQIFTVGTLVLTNSGATLGVPKILSIHCCANDGVLAFKSLSSSEDIKFVYYFLSTTTVRLREEMQKGGQPNLNTDIVKSIDYPAAPLDEQSAVVTFLERETARIDTLLHKTERSIELLKERRAALITAAVTGKIDLRESA